MSRLSSSGIEMHVKCSEQVGGGEQDVARPSAEHLLHGAPAPPLPAEASGPGTSVTNPSASTYTVDQALDHIGFGRFQLVMILYSGFAWLTDAMEVMLLSYLGPAVACQWGIGSSGEAVLTSVVFAGMLVGALFFSTLSDLIGRRSAFLGTVLLTALFGGLSAAAPSFAVLLLCRAVVGAGLAGVPAAYTLALEFLPSASRGRWMSWLQGFWTIGALAETLLAWALLDRHGWRMLLLASAVPFAILLLAYPFIPESPRYCAAKGDRKRTQQILDRVAAANGVALPPGSLVVDAPPQQQNAPKATAQQQQQQQPWHRRQPRYEIGDEVDDGMEEVPLTLTRPGGGATRSPTSSPRSAPAPAGGAKRASPFATLAAKARSGLSAAGQLLSPSLRRTTCLLLVSWFVLALAYYGLVLLATELRIEDAGGGGWQSSGQDGGGGKEEPLPGGEAPDEGGGSGGLCKGKKVQLDRSAFIGVLVTSAAEAPAVLYASFAVDRLGRREAVASSLAATAASLVPVMFGVRGGGLTAALFFGRLFAMAAFTALYVLTPELYPTAIRTMGLGYNNALGRIGGLVAPFIAVDLVSRGQSQLAVGLLAGCCLAAAGAVMAVKRPPPSGQ